MRPQIIFRYVGFVLLINACFLFVSSLISALDHDSAFFPLLYSTLVSALFGIFPFIFVPPTSSISKKEGFLIVLSSWLLSCIVGVLPYLLWGGEFTPTNAWFESVSGFTTTGSSILVNIEAVPRGLLFWRASTHWIGGTGIIIFALSVLPVMGRIGMILYRSEISTLATDNFMYRTRKTLQIVMSVYVGLTLLETIALLFCGLTLFDAVTHAFATIATGGFSTKNLSVAHFKSVPAEVVIMVFMFLSGLHFGLIFIAVTGKSFDILKSTVARYYTAALFAGIILTAFTIHGQPFETYLDSLRYAAFQVISLGTSTGFATADSTLWPPFAHLVLIFFILQGACAGSTSGAIKADRIVIFAKAVIRRIKMIQHPSAVFSLKVDKSPVGEDAVELSLLYISAYLGVIFISTLLLTLMNIDILTAFSGSAATMGNIGPGFGSVGSAGNFSQIPEAGKWVLSVNMLLGRLEIFSIIIFLMPRSWR
ncbi:MAG: cation transporter [Deltaproteobacteria bacterium HGW-Deltaproteobacteria-21]|nr:MAG: cation transporter [Deltaproteobacteria bacterium HGW-Deltaproteobacteria-21]